MNLELIKTLLDADDADLVEDDIALAFEYLMQSHRSAFLDRSISDLDSGEYDVLQHYMLKAVDSSVDATGNHLKYFCVPITISGYQPSGFTPIVQNIDPTAIMHALSSIPNFQQNVELSNIVISRRTLFGGNVYNIFDTSRDALLSRENSYIDEEILINESEEEYVFYVIGRSAGLFNSPDKDDWQVSMEFLQLRLSKCCGVDVSIHHPVLISQEAYYSVFRDVSCRMMDGLEYDDMDGLTSLHMDINQQTRESEITVYSDFEEIARVDTGRHLSLFPEQIISYYHQFGTSLGLSREAVTSTIKGADKSKSSDKKPLLKIIK